MKRFVKIALGAMMLAGGAAMGAGALSTPAQAGVTLSFGVGTPGYYGYYDYYGPRYRGCYWCGRAYYRPYYYGTYYYGPSFHFRSGWDRHHGRRGHWGHHRHHR